MCMGFEFKKKPASFSVLTLMIAVPIFTIKKEDGSILEIELIKVKSGKQNRPLLFYNFSPLNDSYQHYNNCDYKQNMDEPVNRITAHHPQQPQNQQYHSDRPQHLVLLPNCSGYLILGLHYSMVIRFFTLFTPFTSLRSLGTRSFSTPLSVNTSYIFLVSNDAS